MVKIMYQNEVTVEEADLGLTLLQISLKHDIPHIHACGGNARCSTCRVMVHDGLENVLPRNDLEQRLACKKGLEDNVRLACQSRVSGPVRVRRLVLDDTDIHVALAETASTSGRETRIAILFSDIADFTPFSEQNLPYDVVHILNRYFHEMGDAVLENDGTIDKYIGDGMMAMFGLNGETPGEACLNAIRAGLQMRDSLPGLNAFLQRHFGIELGMRIGIHFGEAVIGQMGHPLCMQFTAIGDSVNVAARIEAAVKGTGAAMLISQAVHANVKDQVETGLEITKELKGKQGSYKLYEVLGLKPEAVPESGPALCRLLRRHLRPVVTSRAAPLFLRVAFTDAMCGGANGSIRLPEELARKGHEVMRQAIERLRPIKERFPQVSWADLIALAGAMAVAQTGGPVIDIPLGRIDASQPGPPHKSLDELTFEELKTRFAAQGFSLRELVALSGAHTLGHVRGVPFTEDLFSFSNSYFRLLLHRDEVALMHLLPSDRWLAADPESRQYVEEYALDQELFFKDFAAAYRKLTLPGTSVRAT